MPRILRTLFILLPLALLLSGCLESTGPNTSLPYIKPGNSYAAYGDRDSSDSTSVWDVLRDHFALDHHADNPEVREWIRWYTSHPKALYSLTATARPFMYYILSQVDKYHFPGEIALMPFIESNFNPAVYSTVGAAGMWQLMPGTATGYGAKQDWWYDGRLDVITSTKTALDYLTYLHTFFNNNWILALAAYNSGEGTVQVAMERNAKKDLPTSFWNLHLPQQTRAYVPKLLALAALISDPDKYSVKLPFIPDQPYFAQVDVGSQIDLASAAKLAGISITELSQLNPGFSRWATDPNGPYELLLPVKKVAEFKRRLALLPKDQRVSWTRHVVQNGETLSQIALKYHTTTRLLESINKTNGTMIHVGETLLIPRSTNRLNAKLISMVQNYSTPTSVGVPGPKQIIVNVERGDTLWVIAKRYGVKIRQIKFWNQLSSNDLAPGSQLVIWKPQPRHNYIYYRNPPVYRVKPGDSLNRIAKNFHTSAKAIQAVNGMKGALIHPGQILSLPDGSRGTEAIRIHKAHKKHKAPSHWVSHYRVRPDDGDSLSVIANKFHVSIDALKKANHLRHDKIRIGQLLVIPKVHHAAVPKDNLINVPVRKNRIKDPYIVRTGDNLQLIAKSHRTTVSAIKALNDLTTNTIRVGKKLILPKPAFVDHRPLATHLVVSGDSLGKIAEEYHTSVKTIKAANNIKGNTIHVGRLLYIPI